MVSLRAEEGSHGRVESNDVIVSRLAAQDKVPWYSKPNLRLLYILMVPTCLGVEMTSGFGASLVNSLQAVPSWLEYYHNPRSASLGLMVSMYSLGAVTALPFVPLVVDRFGRRYSILLGGVMSIAGGIIQGSALNFVMFLVARYLLGFTSAICIVAASSLIGELSHPKERVVIGCLFSVSWTLGGVAAAAVTLRMFAIPNNWGWRIPSFLQAVPSLLQVSFIWFLPESPRWLVSNGRCDEAFTILVKYHAEGDEDSEFVKAEYTQIKETLEAEWKIAQATRNSLFATPGIRKRVIITSFLGLFTEWCGIGLVTLVIPLFAVRNFLSLILGSIGIHDNRTKNVITLAKYLWGLVNGAFLSFIVPRYPRRRMFLACSISVFVVFSAWTMASANYSSTHSAMSAKVVLILIFLYSPAYNLAFDPLVYPFLVELYPFHVRARGITIYQWWCRGAAFFGDLVNPIAIEFAGWRWYIVYCLWNAFQIVFIYLVFPETSGRTLEELSFLFEDDQEPLRYGGVETFRRHGETETYGTMETSRGTVYGE